MAPSATRRSGSSRRAQYTTFFSYVAGGLGIAVGAVFLAVSFIDPTAFAGLRGTGSDMIAPVSRAAAGGKGEGQGLFEAISGYFAAGSQNARLKQQLAKARVRLVEADALAEENRRLKALLDIAEDDPKPVAVARLVGSTSASTRRFATLDAGSKDGVAVGMPVRSPLGVVGRVLEVYRSTARILLITDPESVVPIRRAKDGVVAFAQGRGDGTLQLRLINLGINPIKRGDTFVTSGSGGLYRPGMAIAIVTRVTPDGAIAQVLADPAAADYVVVDPAWSPETAAASTSQGHGARGQ